MEDCLHCKWSFEYCDKHGDIIYVKCRFNPPNISSEDSDGWPYIYIRGQSDMEYFSGDCFCSKFTKYE